MKQFLLLFAYIFVLASCNSDVPETDNFKVLPAPQEIKLTGHSNIDPVDLNIYSTKNGITLSLISTFIKESIDHEKSALQLKIDTSLDVSEEGYYLKIDHEKILITGVDEAGLFYGMMTLQQLKEDAEEQNVNLPLCEITDYPKLAYRAIHIDVKHHREKLDYYYQLMDRLASYKINGIIAEIEDKLQYKRRPLIGSEDALSMNEWEKLSKYALERNIEISPLVQGLGHASFILKHEKYKYLRDDPESDWAFNPLDPETYELQFDLYKDALEALPDGDYLHIGGDEVHTTGKGSGQSALELQLIWLNKVCQFAEEQGRTPIFWDDMPLKHAELYRPMFDRSMKSSTVDSLWAKNQSNLEEFIDLFPKNCIYMRWNYQMPETYGNLKAMDWFASNGFQVMGATAGQTRWSLMPQAESNIDNIRSFALSSISSGLDGLLLTLWDDDSPHFELYMRGIMAFAEYTWAGDLRSKSELKTAYRQRAFGILAADSTNAFIDSLEGPVAFWKNALLIDGKSRNNLRRMDNPLDEAMINLPKMDDKGKWADSNSNRIKAAHQHLATSVAVAKKISVMKNHAIRNNYTLEVYEQVNKLVEFSMKSIIALEKLDRSTPENEDIAKAEVLALQGQFDSLSKELEQVYGKARILTKPDNYILDQDHHTHNANQSLDFTWQYYPELLLMEKIETLK